jgi:O-antigen/teichoic acid export membrane protein
MFNLVVVLVLCLVAIGMNAWLIPSLGIEGAAIATMISYFIYNTVIFIFVKKKFGIQPFTYATLRLFVLGVLFMALLSLGLHLKNHWIDILVQSSIIGLGYVFAVYKLNISEDLSSMISKLLKGDFKQIIK